MQFLFLFTLSNLCDFDISFHTKTFVFDVVVLAQIVFTFVLVIHRIRSLLNNLPKDAVICARYRIALVNTQVVFLPFISL